MSTTKLQCACGQVRLEAEGQPFLSVECCCTSCRAAAERMQQGGSPDLLTPQQTTPTAMFRKDRVRITRGADRLRAFRLKPDSATRRAVATCCNTPVFMEFTKGHWIDLYPTLWRDGGFPAPVMRTMAGDLPEPASLPDDLPNHRKHSIGFMAKLMGSWVAMGFRSPKVDVAEA